MNNVIAIHGWETREQNWLCSLGGRDGLLCFSCHDTSQSGVSVIWCMHVYVFLRVCYTVLWCSLSSSLLASWVLKEAHVSLHLPWLVAAVWCRNGGWRVRRGGVGWVGRWPNWKKKVPFLEFSPETKQTTTKNVWSKRNQLHVQKAFVC